MHANVTDTTVRKRELVVTGIVVVSDDLECCRVRSVVTIAKGDPPDDTCYIETVRVGVYRALYLASAFHLHFLSITVVKIGRHRRQCRPYCRFYFAAAALVSANRNLPLSSSQTRDLISFGVL